jgi:hypothetical protein
MNFIRIEILKEKFANIYNNKSSMVTHIYTIMHEILCLNDL